MGALSNVWELLVSGVAPPPHPRHLIPCPARKDFTGPKDNRIYLSTSGVHLDIIIPTNLILPELQEQLQFNISANLLAFGWGDKGFYLDTPTWAELKARTALNAMIIPSPTTMHVTEHQHPDTKWAAIDLAQDQLDILNEYIKGYFALDQTGKIQELVGHGYTPTDRFYEATGKYHCFKTCNTWVNIALKKMGIKTAIWTPVDKGVLRYVQEQPAHLTVY